MAGSRVFVHEKVYDEFIERMTHKLKDYQCGDPLNMSTTLGPQTDKDQFEKTLEYIDLGKN